MKKIIFILIAISFVCISCSRPEPQVSIIDGNQKSTNGLIAQKWICQKVLAEGNEPIYTNPSTGEVLIEAQAVGESYDENYSITFTENPDKVLSEGTFNLKITIKIIGSFVAEPVTKDLLNPSLLGNGNWTRISDNQIKIETDVRTIDATIEELTETSLILKSVLKDFLVNYQGQDYLIDINTKMTFIKG